MEENREMERVREMSSETLEEMCKGRDAVKSVGRLYACPHKEICKHQLPYGSGDPYCKVRGIFVEKDSEKEESVK